jgi:Raf kinase inhibitor-like YbhB/YbcL family protein
VLEKLPIELGHALKGQRAGVQNITFYRLLAARKVPRIGVHSNAFGNMEPIPTRYTADGDGASPPIEWYSIPDGAQSLVLIVEDGDSPTPHPLVHAIAVNIDPDRRSLAEDSLVMSDDGLPTDVDLGLNSVLKRGWTPPDPPPGHGEHRYAFQLFALANAVLLPSGAGRHDVVEAVMQSAIAAGCLIGTYERPRPISAGESANDDAMVARGLTPAIG